MDAISVPSTPPVWHPVLAPPRDLTDLDLGEIYAVEGSPHLAITLVSNADGIRSVVTLPRMCMHLNLDLVFEGRVSDNRMGCYHRRRTWCLISGASSSDSPDVPLYPTKFDGHAWYALTPCGPACAPSCRDAA